MVGHYDVCELDKWSEQSMYNRFESLQRAKRIIFKIIFFNDFFMLFL